jgi:hypothetical protein
MREVDGKIKGRENQLQRPPGKGASTRVWVWEVDEETQYRMRRNAGRKHYTSIWGNYTI